MPNPPSYRDLQRLKQQKNRSFATRFKASAIGGSRAVPAPIIVSAPAVQYYYLLDTYKDLGTPFVCKVTSTFEVSYIKLEIQAFSFYYRMDQLGSTNNPNLTCYRGTNYRFVHNQSVHPFALRASSGDTTTQISGTFNNDPSAGIVNDTVYFTPNDDTPDSIVYQCTVHPSMIGTITILNY